MKTQTDGHEYKSFLGDPEHQLNFQFRCDSGCKRPFTQTLKFGDLELNFCDKCVPEN